MRRLGHHQGTIMTSGLAGVSPMTGSFTLLPLLYLYRNPQAVFKKYQYKTIRWSDIGMKNQWKNRHDVNLCSYEFWLTDYQDPVS